MSKQPKGTGKYSHWLNIIREENREPVCINWDQVDEWKELLHERDEVNPQNHRKCCFAHI